MVGNIGKLYGEANLNLFGYLAYFNLFIFLYPLYRLYKDKNLFQKIDFFVGWMMFFISLIILQSLILEFHQIGGVGTTLKLFLLPHIGKAGIWLLWILTIMVSLILLYDEIAELQIAYRKFIEWRIYVIGNIQNIFSKFDNPFFDKQSTDIMTTMVSQRKNRVESKIPNIKPKRVKMIREKRTIVKKNVDSKISNKDKITIKNREIKKKIPKKTIEKSQNNIVEELEENRRLLKQIERGKIKEPKNFILPKLDFLEKRPISSKKIDEIEIEKKVGELLEKFEQFNIEGDIHRVYSGPLVTIFEFKPAPNIKVSKIINLQKDLAMALSAESIRIQAPIKGRDVIGIEISNRSFDKIYLREILEDDTFTNSKSPLILAMGKDIVGNPFVTDLKKLPHLLIAGTTGSGKSVGINAMILSLLYRNSPDDLKLILIDLNMLELAIYNDIPHLLTPVITDSKKAIVALENVILEMERRYKIMAISRTKNIDNYNQKISRKKNLDPLPYIVVVIDELGDLMMSGGKEFEYSITRLAQMAKASGIHLIVATQRPSVDVITGLIKANLPSRLSYRVGQKIDSKMILDELGADVLLGRGDSLFTPPSSNSLVRLHAPWNSEKEIEKIVEFLKKQRTPQYDDSYSSLKSKLQREILL
jgi:S-DNA-T family DNA segregation ATPase FtsK/SpoIIIE